MEREAYEVVAPGNSAVSRNARGRATEKPLTTHEILHRSGTNTLDIYRIMNLYLEAANSYASRSLTYLGDRMNAFQGVMTSYASLFPENARPTFQEIQACRGLLGPVSISGNGVRQMKISLDMILFETQDPNSMRIVRNTGGTVPLPSWSWLGWSSSFEQYSYYENRLVVVEVLDAANIKVSMKDSVHSGLDQWPRDYHFESSMIGSEVGIALHIWASVIVCELGSDVQFGGSYKMWALRSHLDPALADCELDPYKIDAARRILLGDQHLEFLIWGYHSYFYYLLPIQRHRGTNLYERNASMPTGRVIRPSHPEAFEWLTSLECEHVRII